MTQQTYPPAGEAAPCVAHPEVATNLRCSRCERPICPRCLVQTPVGARCRECARLRRLPVFDVTAPVYGKAAAVSAGVGLAAGLVWSLFPLVGLLSFIQCAVAGYVIGEAVSRSANRRQSRGLKALAVGGVIVAYVGHYLWFPLAIALTGIPGGIQIPEAAGLGAATVARIAGQPITWLVVAVGGFVAASRID